MAVLPLFALSLAFWLPGDDLFRPFQTASVGQAALAAIPAPGKKHDAIGQIFTYPVRGRETLLDIARHFELGYLDIVAANPGIDPWLPGQGTRLTIPTAYVLPDAPREGVVINLAEQRLYYFPPGDKPVQTYPLGVGRDGLETPMGSTRIKRKKDGPTWRPTKRMRQEDPELPAEVPAGPDNPLGEYALYLGWPQYLIHGTNKPWGVGRRVSSGCIRLYPEGIERLFSQVEVGTKVTVVDQPAKLGWVGSDLYLEVHTSQNQADQLEKNGEFEFEDIDDLILRIISKAGDAQPRLLWDVVQKAVQERSGVPVQITRSTAATQAVGEAEKAATALQEMARAAQAPRKPAEVRSMIPINFIEQEFAARGASAEDDVPDGEAPGSAIDPVDISAHGTGTAAGGSPLMPETGDAEAAETPETGLSRPNPLEAGTGAETGNTDQTTPPESRILSDQQEEGAGQPTNLLDFLPGMARSEDSTAPEDRASPEPARADSPLADRQAAGQDPAPLPEVRLDEAVMPGIESQPEPSVSDRPAPARGGVFPDRFQNLDPQYEGSGERQPFGRYPDQEKEQGWKDPVTSSPLQGQGWLRLEEAQ